MRQKVIWLNRERNVTLTACIQDAGGEFQFPLRPAMLVLPGGAYAMCSDREADPVAMAYLKAGYQAFVLRYSTGEHKSWPNPMNDYEDAMTLIRENAKLWHIDVNRVCAVGFSAGGHLCACGATIAKNKPAAAILVYPAILKDICDICQPGMPYPHEHVTDETSPCFLVAARDDRTVDIRNSLMMQLALTEKGIPFESHIYSYGGHGFSTAEEWVLANRASERVPHWVADSVGWLKETLGTLTAKGFSEPEIAVCVNGDSDPFLSVACTLNHIRKQPENVQALIKPLYDGMQAVATARGFSMEGLIAAVGSNSVRELMEMVLVNADTISAIDRSLREIENLR